jgi:hypothetical protein
VKLSMRVAGMVQEEVGKGMGVETSTIGRKHVDTSTGGLLTMRLPRGHIEVAAAAHGCVMTRKQEMMIRAPPVTPLLSDAGLDLVTRYNTL